MTVPKDIFPQATPALGATRRNLAPEIHEAFTRFSERVFADRALPEKTKQLIAVAAAHITQCPHCIRVHTKAALRRGASPEEIMEAIWVAVEVRAGGTYAHSALALDTIDEVMSKPVGNPSREPEDTRTVAEIIRDDERLTSAQRGTDTGNGNLIGPVITIVSLAAFLVVAWIFA